MFIEFSKTNKKQQQIIEKALWFAKSYLLPRHRIDEIEIESVKVYTHMVIVMTQMTGHLLLE